MHTQTASTSELRAGIASRLHAAAGLGLYLLTLAGEVVLGAGVRWLLTYLGAAALLAPLWSAYWRSREYAADAHAASLGQSEDLARHLADIELALDFPRRRFPIDLAEHPPVAHRIERLTAG